MPIECRGRGMGSGGGSCALTCERIGTVAEGTDERVEQHSAELARTEARYRTLLRDMNIAFAEVDIRQARAMLDAVKAGGVTDFGAFAERNPDFIQECIEVQSVTDVSDALVDQMGYQSREHFFSDPPKLRSESTRRHMLMRLEALFHRRRDIITSVVQFPVRGRQMPVAIRVNFTPDWNFSLSTHIDISEQQRAHDMVLAAQQELARANRIAAVGAFSASLVHELNQPITAMRIDAQASRRWLKQEPPQVGEAVQSLDRLIRNAERIAAIAQRTRDQISMGRQPHAPFELRPLLRETLDLLDRELDLRQAKFAIDCDGTVVLGDRVEIQQVITNLVTNAAEAMADTPPGHRRGSIRAQIIDHERVSLTVADSGPGLSSGRLEDLFKPFHTTKHNGVGLGLQICKTIVEAHGGSLVARSGASGGAVFAFDLPRACPALDAGRVDPEAAGAAQAEPQNHARHVTGDLAPTQQENDANAVSGIRRADGGIDGPAR
jgi:C4-dicarboxylate-specific signal transduction histidine kinase